MRMKTKTSLRVEVGRERGNVEGGMCIPTEVGRCSLSSALSARCCESVDIFSFLCSDKYKEPITALRATNDPDRRREFKQQLPAITPAGVFYPKRGNRYLQTYSGMLGVDIDGKDNPTIESWTQVAYRIGERSPSVVYAGLSAGGYGCFVLFRIATPQRYAEHYTALVGLLCDLNLNADRACCDLARLRYASYDPMPYLNPQAIPHQLDTTPQHSERGYSGVEATKKPILCVNSVRVGCAPTSTAGENCGGDMQHLFSRIEQAVRTVEAQAINIADAYVDWYRIGCALASSFGERGRELYHVISAQSSKYQRGECDVQFNRCLRTHGIGVGTLLHYFKSAGVRW